MSTVPVRRRQITDKVWAAVGPALLAALSRAGRPARHSPREFLEICAYVLRHGVCWRALPPSWGHPSALQSRFQYWAEIGVFGAVHAALLANKLDGLATLFIDSTTCKAGVDAAGARTARGGQEDQGLGRSCGGFTTKVHAAVTDEYTLVSLAITGGQAADISHIDDVMAGVPEDVQVTGVVADKGYDSNKLRENLTMAGIEAVVPGKKNRVVPIEYDKEKYKGRNVVERFFGKAKRYSRVAYRREKLAVTYRAFVLLAASLIMLRV